MPIVHYDRSDLRVVAKLIGANFNVTTDQALTLQISDSADAVLTGEGDFILDEIIVRNASVSLTTAAGGIYTAASKGGSAIVAAGQVYTALTSSVKWVALTKASISLTDVLNTSALYFSLTTAQGAAATADIYVYGRLFQKI
jgi:hypothetical protein